MLRLEKIPTESFVLKEILPQGIIKNVTETNGEKISMLK